MIEWIRIKNTHLYSGYKKPTLNKRQIKSKKDEITDH